MAKMQKLLAALKATPLRDLPWRRTRDPYKILVSEIMLQQTQVERVVPFYTRFVRQFPNARALAKAPLSRVLKAWQGLGYNRRAVYLHQTAKLLSSAELLSKKSSGLPSRAALSGAASRARLFSQEVAAPHLPGVGPYTKAAIEAFAYNKPTVFVETNIRTVFLYYCFRRLDISSRSKKQISDKEILPLVSQALKKSKMSPREFYARLMDLGTDLKKQGIKLNSKSAHYTKQSKFEGSRRQKQAARLRALLASGASEKKLRRTLDLK